MIKRVFDLILSILCLLLFLPLIMVLTLLIYIKMGPPIFFRQQRPGLGGKPFYIYKFRTMTNKTDSAGKLLDDQDRLTGFGEVLRRFSLDELPQLYNVLKGDLSFVGPRPLLMEYLERYTKEQFRRHAVKPGITGWAQVNGRNAISWSEKFTYDLWYVDNQNLWLDLKILWLTLINVIRTEGINREGSATTPEFMGSDDCR